MARLGLCAAAACTLATPAWSETAGQAAGKPGSRIYEDEASWENPQSVRPTEDQLFAHTPYTHDWQARSYYWLGMLDAGYVAVINPFQWTYGILGSWGLNIIILDPQGRVFNYDGKLGDGSPRTAPHGMEIRAGSTLIVSEGAVHHWQISVPGFSCNLSFNNILPAWIPGDGVARYTASGDFYSRYSLPAPWAELAGTLSVFGATIPADGQCLLDSSETLLPLTRTNAEIRAFRAFSPPGTPSDERWMLNQLTTISHPAFGSLHLPMLLLAHGGSWVLTTKDFVAEPFAWDALADPPYPYPVRFTVRAQQRGITLEGTFTASRPYHITDVFARMPRIFRAVATLFLKRPVIYRMLGDFSGTVTSPDGTVQQLSLIGQAEYVVAK